MIKSDLIRALAAIGDDELVMLRVQDTILAINSVEIQQAEPPIFAVIATADPNDQDFIRIINERNQPGEVPEAISARQFKMRLYLDGLKDQAGGWIAQQSELVRIAYESSATFRRDDPMMQDGFAALGFTAEQVDAFFRAASAL